MLFILFFHSCHWPQTVLGREPAGNLYRDGHQHSFIHACFAWMHLVAQVCFQNTHKKFSNFQNVCFRHCHYHNRKKMFSYKALKIEWRNRVSNKSIGSNRRIRVVVIQRRDSTDLQSLENGNFMGWWYIEHSNYYSSQKFWIHKCRSLWWERPFISCRCPKGMVVCQI